ncbi:MAG: hypothetical protein ABIP41_07010 [Croceibacterium sp.]
MARLALLSLYLLAACQRRDAPVQRIELDAAREGPEQPIASPDTKDAVWAANADGWALEFGKAGQKPLLTLECRVHDTPPHLRVIRHVFSRLGESALFPVLGSGPNARFKLDAANVGGEARWQGDVPLGDEQLDVFHSGRLEATLPGGGSLNIPASPAPGEFINRCRAASPQPAAPTPANSPAPVSSPAPAL